MLNYGGAAFQAYQPGVAYQVTSQYPESSVKPAPRNAAIDRLRPTADYHANEAIDTADESDVVSIKPSKARSGNTFTVKKVCMM